MFFFLRFYYLFLERREGKEKEWERNINVWLLLTPTGDLARKPGMCPDWKLNQKPFDLQADTQSTEPHQPGYLHLLPKCWFVKGKINHLIEVIGIGNRIHLSWTLKVRWPLSKS